LESVKHIKNFEVQLDPYINDNIVESILKLVKNNSSELTVTFHSFYNISEKMVEQLFKYNKLDKLGFKNIKYHRDQKMVNIFGLLKYSKFNELKFSNFATFPRGALYPIHVKTISNVLKYCYPKKIEFDNAIKSNGIKYIVNALKMNSTVEELILTNNSIYSDGIIRLAHLLKFNSCIRSFVLVNLNGYVSDNALIKLFEAIRYNRTLEYLEIVCKPSENSNEISREVREMLKYITIKHIKICIGMRYTCAILDGVKDNRSIEKLDISKHSYMGKKECEKLCEVLKCNRVLKEIVLYIRNVYPRYLNVLLSGVEQNSKIEKLFSSCISKEAVYLLSDDYIVYKKIADKLELNKINSSRLRSLYDQCKEIVN